MSERRRRLGRRGEDLAVGYLEGRGYKVLERNFRTRWGEIDIVAQRGKCTVFVEVRTTSGNAYGAPEESVTPQKKAHLIATAEEYLQARGQEEGEWRIDVVAIQVDRGGRVRRMELVENAVQL